PPTSKTQFETHPDRYRHWTLVVEGDMARLTMEVEPFAGQDDKIQLKSNSYDLSVDIELADAVQRLRFTHPEVKAVVVTSGHDRILRRREHLHARLLDAPLQGQLLQVHERDASRDRGGERAERAALSRGLQRGNGGRRIRARP